ncbi:MAG: AAA family ATPase, partial [Acidimicrobiales bacterium]
MSTGTDIGAVGAGPSTPVQPPISVGEIDEAVAVAKGVHDALSAVLLGTPRAVTVAVVAAMSGGHLLIEDVPGVGKTVLARAIATALGVQLSRVQGHPDLLPSDVTGVTVFSPDTGTWDFRPGPVFAHVVLLDELNRTPPRTQSALLEAMEEQQVTVDGESWPLPRPHLVIGTQNPVGQLGTYPLVESQLDRFALSTSLGYPDARTEAELALRRGGREALSDLGPVCTTDAWQRAVRASRSIRIAPRVAEYAVAL